MASHKDERSFFTLRDIPHKKQIRTAKVGSTR